MTKNETMQKLIAKLRKDAFEATTLVAHYVDENKALRQEISRLRTGEFLQELDGRRDGETEKLRAFAKDIMEAWPDGGIEGDDLQEIACRHGMLAPETRFEPCGEWCNCNSMNCLDSDDWKGGVECYRRTELLTGDLMTQR